MLSVFNIYYKEVCNKITTSINIYVDNINIVFCKCIVCWFLATTTLCHFIANILRLWKLVQINT